MTSVTYYMNDPLLQKYIRTILFWVIDVALLV